MGEYESIAADCCDSVRVTSGALPGVLLAETERLPAVAGFARFPYTLIHSHTLP